MKDLAARTGGRAYYGRVLTVQTDSKGNGLQLASRTVTIDVSEETYRSAQKTGFVFRQEVTPLATAASLRIVIRDLPSGNLGPLSIPIGRPATSPSRK